MLVAVCPAQEHWSYLTYLGGAGSDKPNAVKSDGAGGSFIAGETYSIGPPFSTQGPGYSSVPSAFIARIDAAGQMVFATRLGYGGATSLAVDAAGNAFVAGTMRLEPDFATPGVFQPEAGSSSVFIAKFSPSGEKLFGTYFGGLNGVQIRTMTLDGEGRPIFCGSSWGNAVPLSSSLFQPVPQITTAFCAQLSSDGANLIFSTLLGKPSSGFGSYSIATSAVVDPEGNLVVAGTSFDNGFASTVDPQFEDRRRSLYRSQNGPYQSTGGPQFGSIESLVTVGTEIFVGTLNAGAWASSDRGDTWRQLSRAPSGVLVAHPGDTRFLCVTAVNTVFCSRDGGVSWPQMYILRGQITLVPDPRVEGGFFIITNQTERFSYLALGPNPPLTGLSTNPRWLTINPSGDRILAVDVNRALLLSEDRGATFRKLADNITLVAEAPSAPYRLYGVRFFRLSGRDSFIIKSDDGGLTWTDTALDIPFTLVRQLSVDPSDPNTVYVVTGSGAYRSLDAGDSWHLWTPPGLDNVGVQTLHFDDQNRAWAGTVQGGHGFLIKLKIDKLEILSGKILSGAGGANITNIRINSDGQSFFTGFTFGLTFP